MTFIFYSTIFFLPEKRTSIPRRGSYLSRANTVCAQKRRWTPNTPRPDASQSGPKSARTQMINRPIHLCDFIVRMKFDKQRYHFFVAFSSNIHCHVFVIDKLFAFVCRNVTSSIGKPSVSRYSGRYLTSKATRLRDSKGLTTLTPPLQAAAFPDSATFCRHMVWYSSRSKYRSYPS